MTFKQGYGYQTYNGNVNLKQGYNHAKFEIYCFHGVGEKANVKGCCVFVCLFVVVVLLLLFCCCCCNCCLFVCLFFGGANEEIYQLSPLIIMYSAIVKNYEIFMIYLTYLTIL